MAVPSSAGPDPYRPLLFLCLVLVGAALPWYFSYQPAVDDFEQQMRIGLMLLPVALILAVKFLSATQRPGLPLPDGDSSSIHRAGGSAWGVGILLAVVLAMVWYQSSMQESWHPAVRA